MLKLPLNFQSSASASGVPSDSWTIQSGSQNTKCAVPTEFGGSGGAFSPEDLFLQALINCFVGTFKVYAKASKINFDRLDVFGSLNVDKNSYGAVCMQSCFLDINIFGAEKIERVQTLVEKVFRDGFILNSVKTEIRHKLQVH